jgi:hypothetical protein
MPDPAAIVARFSTLSDEEVVSRILEGDTPLFEVLMRRHNERVFRRGARDSSQMTRGSRRCHAGGVCPCVRASEPIRWSRAGFQPG